MNQVIILLITLLSLTLAVISLYKQESDRPFYLKIEVQYGR
ncbi:hypothetical protein [Nostoc sp. 106C]|nr:hypothetical protein [Nostoc sp. 106C]